MRRKSNPSPPTDSSRTCDADRNALSFRCPPGRVHISINAPFILRPPSCRSKQRLRCDSPSTDSTNSRRCLVNRQRNPLPVQCDDGTWHALPGSEKHDSTRDPQGNEPQVVIRPEIGTGAEQFAADKQLKAIL
eukprot:m.38013 g.38013  ORF g.38013 m.38013 type:complete len:133 (+) comp32505_c0_seq1:1786-2184(+)